ncbi:MAG: hypothetical protein A3C22_02465 [Candidatus Levybacteria bacterium RIFCSPHIGHO2_02_FULL_37_10]|nr:MAG: hypothetical protein A3C22_02465 [Candidatus Levybacteria bacterium RIFCSPHIGHO2_02_FULL_37_10]
MPKIGNPTPYADMPCGRCSGKRKEIGQWTEKIKTENGTTVIEHAQIICTNRECQSKFETLLNAEIKKREALRLIRTENFEKRKAARTARRPLL